MMRYVLSVVTLSAYLPAFEVCGQTATQEVRFTTPDEVEITTYQVNKKVSEFPEEEDFSSPESACAVIQRIMADGTNADWKRVSTSTVASQIPYDASKRRIPPKTADMWRNALIKEVMVFEGTQARVFSEIHNASGVPMIDPRSVELEDGYWLNSGQDFPTKSIEEARDKFRRICARKINTAKSGRPEVDDPESYLKPFVEFLKNNGENPKDFVMKTLAKHKIVIMGEIHHRPLYWGLNSTIIGDPEFPKTVGTICMEVSLDDQPLVDKFLASKEPDTTPVIDALRDILWMGWPDQPMLNFFTSVWRANQNLPPEQRVRILFVDLARPWKEIPDKWDPNKEDVDRDVVMSETILNYMARNPEDKRNILFIVGAGHAMLDMIEMDGANPMKSAGWYLREKLGRESVFAFMQHQPSITNNGQIDGRACLGLFDSAVAELGNKPIAFPLSTGPFGEQHYDASPDRPSVSAYRDGYDGYIYLGPLEDEIFSPLIPGFYTDEFVKDLDARHRYLFGNGLVESGVIPDLTGKSFAAWMSSSWGKPRDWRNRLGPITAWHYGSE